MSAIDDYAAIAKRAAELRAGDLPAFASGGVVHAGMKIKIYDGSGSYISMTRLSSISFAAPFKRIEIKAGEELSDADEFIVHGEIVAE